MMRLPLLTGLDRDVQVELVFCSFNPVPDLVNDPSGSFPSEESGLLHGWPLLQQQVVVPDARNEQAPGVQPGCNRLNRLS